MKHIKFILFQNEKLSELKLTLIFITLLHYRTKVLVNICHQLCNNFYWNILAFALRKKFPRTRWINRFCDTLTTASSSLKCLQKFPLKATGKLILLFFDLWYFDHDEHQKIFFNLYQEFDLLKHRSAFICLN